MYASAAVTYVITPVLLFFLPPSYSFFIPLPPYPSRYLALWTSFAALLPSAATPEVTSNSRYPELAWGYRQCC